MLESIDPATTSGSAVRELVVEKKKNANLENELKEKREPVRHLPSSR